MKNCKLFSKGLIEAPFPVMIHAEDGEVLLISKVWTEITGYTHVEIPTISDWTEKSCGERREIARGLINDLYSLDSVKHEGETTIRTATGENRVWEFSTAPLGILEDGRRTVISMAVDITRRRRLEDNSAHLAAIVESTNDAIISCDMAGVIIFWNPGAEKMFGYSTQEAIGRSIFMLIPENRISEGKDKLRRLQQEEEVISFDTVRLRKDGKPIDVSLVFSRIKNSEGKLLAHSGIMRDITARKQDEEKLKSALKEKNELLYEVHHRVKNNLQIVSSLLNLQRGQITHKWDREKFKDTQNRIKSIALVHDMLRGTHNLGMVILKEYFKTLGINLLKTYEGYAFGTSFIVDGDHVEVSLDAAVSLGLIVNELITNSLKHAFLQETEREIHITIRNFPGNFKLIVRDNGCGLPDSFDIDGVPTLGIELIKTLADKVKGRAEFHNDRGAVFTLYMPPLQFTEKKRSNVG